MPKPIYLLNGPNLNLLGTREPEVYGHLTLEAIENDCQQLAAELNVSLVFRQSNSEGELIDWIQEASNQGSGLIINAAALTHTSIGLLDAILASKLPCIEVHLSNIYRREEFRHPSYISKGATGVICGFGSKSYLLAIKALKDQIGEDQKNEVG